MKKGFTQLVEIPLEVEDEDKYQPVSDDPMSNLILEAIKNDDLRKMERAKRWSESISCLVIDQCSDRRISDGHLNEQLHNSLNAVGLTTKLNPTNLPWLKDLTAQINYKNYKICQILPKSTLTFFNILEAQH